MASRFNRGSCLEPLCIPRPDIMRRSVEASGASILTVSLRRESSRDAGAGSRFWDMVKGFGARILPNTAGCHTPREAITTAQMAREVFETNWVKLEVIANDDTLQPEVFGLVEAARSLVPRRLPGLPLLHRGFERGGAVAGRRLPGSHAVGGSHRHGARPHEPVRAAQPARLFPGYSAYRRCRDRRALPCRRGHGDGLRWHPA